MNYYLILLFTFFLIFLGCNKSNTSRIKFDKQVKVIVLNTLEIPREDEQIIVNISDIKSVHPDFNEKAIVVKVGDAEIPSQLYDSDLDAEMDQILFNVYLQPQEERELTIFYAAEGNVKTEYKNRTYAELAVKVNYTKEGGVYKSGRFENVAEFRVPDDHIDHNKLFKYEGPGWESEFVGYRFYLDWRNATDIFGKKTSELVLHKIGVIDTAETTDSYHEMSDWGMDILKVGNTLGIGSIGTWNENRINMVSETDSIHWKLVCNGPLISEFQTIYYGWQVGNKKADLYARTSIAAGSRLTKVKLKLKGNIDNIVTGFAKHENVPEMIKSDDDGGWQYISSYGKQSLADDNLGIAIFYNYDITESLKDNKENHFVIINPVNNEVEYYFAAAWEKETTPVNGRSEFIEYLQRVDAALNNPIKIRIK